MTSSKGAGESSGHAVEKEATTPRPLSSSPIRRHEEKVVTIQDVAARSGVSISTVSRVVTGTVAVEPATAERVREAIIARLPAEPAGTRVPSAGDAHHSAVKQETSIDALLVKHVDGLILASTGLIPTVDGEPAVGRIVDAGVPCVAVDRDLGKMPVDQVLIDNDRGASASRLPPPAFRLATWAGWSAESMKPHRGCGTRERRSSWRRSFGPGRAGNVGW